MENLLNFLKEFNLQTIISMIVVVWYFSRDVKGSIEKVDSDLKVMNTRISRVEGTIYGKDIYKKLDEEE